MKTGAHFSHLTRFSVLLLYICGLVCAGGCTAPPGSSIEVKQAPVGGVSKHKIVSVEVTTRDTDFSPKQVDLLTDSIADGLRKSARFDKIYVGTTSNEHEADLKLSVVVQFVIGPNTHKVQSIESSVVLTDPSDGKTLASANVNAHSGWALFGGHMTNAIAQLSDQIVDFATKR